MSDLDNAEFRHIWHEQIKIIDEKIAAYDPQYSQMSAVKIFEESLADMDYEYHVHYANSSASAWLTYIQIIMYGVTAV